MKILVADYTAYMRKVLSREIKKLGHEVIEAGNGKEAVRKSKTENPDVIFMELVLPDMDSISAIKEIKSEMSGRIIICSAVWDKLHVMEAFEAGATGYIRKPIDEESIRQVLFQTESSLQVSCDII